MYYRDRLARILMQSVDSLTLHDALALADRLLEQGYTPETFFN